MVLYDKQKFKNRIINIMKNNSPEESIVKIMIMNNPYTNNKIGKKKAIKLYILNANKVDIYDESITERLRIINDLL